MNNLEKLRLENKIKISYLRHRGDQFAVSEELGLPADYVARVVKKIKKKEERSVKLFVADNLTQYILSGYESRVQYLVSILKKIDSNDVIHMSACHRYPTEQIVEDGKLTYRCLHPQCGVMCKTYEATHTDILQVKKELLEQWREEDNHLINFASKMGYTVKDPQSPVSVSQNFLVLNNNKNISDADRENMKLIENMSPVDREKILKSIESEIVNDEQEKTVL